MRWVLVLPLLLGACVHRYTRVEEPSLAATREVDVWTNGERLRLHGFTMLRDSVTGIPLDSPLACDACRLGVPLTQVDSLVVGHETPGLKVIGGVLLFVYALARLP
jgi:hypothetical protein